MGQLNRRSYQLKTELSNYDAKSIPDYFKAILVAEDTAANKNQKYLFLG